MIKQHNREHSHHSFWQAFGYSLQHFVQWIEEREQLARQRQQLLSMDDRLLSDIGLSRAEAEQLAKTIKPGKQGKQVSEQPGHQHHYAHQS